MTLEFAQNNLIPGSMKLTGHLFSLGFEATPFPIPPPPPPHLFSPHTELYHHRGF